MTDREMLELAARAAGIDGWWEQKYLSFIKRDGGSWRPLDDDGDALRLAVKLRIDIMVEFDRVDAFATAGAATEYLYQLPSATDPCSATRRAITRVAAEIGKSMEGADG